MSGILGIVSEYNPFHNGHILHLKESLKKTKADFTIAIMSGNFVQRGDTSLTNKWIKTKMALQNGVDLVIELPTIYSVSSAENVIWNDGCFRSYGETYGSDNPEAGFSGRKGAGDSEAIRKGKSESNSGGEKRKFQQTGSSESESGCPIMGRFGFQ